MSESTISLNEQQMQQAIIEYALRTHGFRPSHINYQYGGRHDVVGVKLISDGRDGTGYVGKPAR